MYSLTLQMASGSFSGAGSTAKEAVEEFAKKMPSPFKVMTMGTLVFASDQGSKTQYLGPARLKRLAMPLTKLLLIKQFDAGLK